MRAQQGNPNDVEWAVLPCSTGAIAWAARWGLAGLSLVSVDSTTLRAPHDAAGMIMESGTLDALENRDPGRAGEGRHGKGAPARNETGK